MDATIGAAPLLRRLDLAQVASDPDAAADRRSLIRRGALPDAAVRAAVRGILDEMRADPDSALRDLAARFGGGRSDGTPLVERSAILEARDRLAPGVRRALEAASDAVRRVSLAGAPASVVVETAKGVTVERRWAPLDAVGCYVPGGGAPYPSTLVMTVVPALAAGVGRIVVATPAGRSGDVDPVVLGAAGVLGIDTVLVAGGAQAIGALAFGLPRAGLAPVDRIVGPGNAWVTAAKLELVGEVSIDLPAGPSEGVVLVDGGADPDRAAADLLTQAEHGPDSPVLLVTTDVALASAVERAVMARLAGAARRAVLEQSLSRHGRIILAPDLDTAIAFINDYAPEHLSIDVGPLEATVAGIRNAGSVFVGPWAPESAGDYATGANHVLPTGGLARSCGALAVETFGRFVQVQRLTRDGLAGLRATIGTLAEAEGLLAHRDAVEVRFAAAGSGGGR